MTFSSEAEVCYIAEGLIDQTLPRSKWTHAAHFAAAVWLLRHPDYDPFLEMADFIRDYNESSGTPNTDSGGYHETITIASLRATQFELEKRPPNQPLHIVVNEILNSDMADPAWLMKYWNKSTLFSVKARREWVEPDLVPLPFP